MGGQTIRAVAPSGAGRVVQRVPVDLRLFDLSEDGRALVNRVNFRSGINCLAPGQTAERDLSWFDASEVDAMSPDGETILITEFGEGGGTGTLGGVSCERPRVSLRCVWATVKCSLYLRTEAWP